MMNTCIKCGIRGSIEQFPRAKYSDYRCRNCIHIYNVSRRDKTRIAFENFKNTRRKLIRDYKEKYPCRDCGVKYPYYVMDFDHRLDKLFMIGPNITKTSLKRLYAEIDKCDLVCSNCHRVRTHARMKK